MSRWLTSACRQTAMRGASSRAGMTTIPCRSGCGGASSIGVSVACRSWWYSLMGGCQGRRGRGRRSRSAVGSSAVEAVESVGVVAGIERMPIGELASESVVHLVTPQRLVAADAAPADHEHACLVGELCPDPADRLLERRRLEVVEDLRAEDQIP